MIRKYCQTCKKETYFSSIGICFNCIDDYKQNEFYKEKQMFMSMTNDEKFLYIFNKIYELEKKYKENYFHMTLS